MSGIMLVRDITHQWFGATKLIATKFQRSVPRQNVSATTANNPVTNPTVARILVQLKPSNVIIVKRACPNAGFQAGPSLGAGRGAVGPRGGFGGGFRGGFAGAGAGVGAPRPATCYKCGGPNHYARDCQAQAMKCYACGKLGHISRDCTAPNGGPLNSAGKVCYKCGQAGHISRECAAVDTNGGVDPTIEAVNQIQPTVATASVA
ncbi:hypothetical protein MMC12_001370 [Toensbergia leucococca]|nr:hypothetical protein [Toensbergia leucococca]